jgi:putative toxin-antitoxin system antitoxin component (TIGR02293 family)
MTEALKSIPSRVADALGGSKVLRIRVRTPEDLIEATRMGLSYASFDAVRIRFDIKTELMTRLLDLPARTLARRKHEKRFHAAESDRLVRLARVGALAEDTLGSTQKAARWLQAPNRALAGDAPLARLDTDVGAREVEDLLLRIAYGVYS